MATKGKTSKNNAKQQWLYPLRMDRDTANYEWASQYAWLRDENDYYLVKYRTPAFWCMIFPTLMNLVPHKMWKVDRGLIDNTPEFKPRFKKPTKEQEAESRSRLRRADSAGIFTSILGSGAIGGVILGIISLFVPSDQYPSGVTEVGIELLEIIGLYAILIGIIYLFFHKRVTALWSGHKRLKAALKSITDGPSITMRMHISWLPSGLGNLCQHTLVALFELAILYVYLVVPIVDPSGVHNSYAKTVFNGLVSWVFTLLFVVVCSLKIFPTNALPQWVKTRGKINWPRNQDEPKN